MSPCIASKEDGPDGGLPGRTPGVNYRDAERVPVCIPAQLLNWESTNRNCVITDFSRNGMGVELVRRASNDPALIRWLTRGVCVSIGFMLPGNGRRVRANADVMHVEQDGQRIRFGLHFPVSNAVVMEAILEGGNEGRCKAAAAQSHDAAALGGDSPPPTAVSWPQMLQRIGDGFFAEARERLTNYSVTAPEDAAAFMALVSFHNNEHGLRELFDEAACTTPELLRDALMAAVTELTPVQQVRDLLIEILDEQIRRQVHEVGSVR